MRTIGGSCGVGKRRMRSFGGCAMAQRERESNRGLLGACHVRVE